MPKTYNEIERNHIRQTLRAAGAKALYLFGVKRTTVDYLVEEAHLAKGSFYLFYKSKEELFYDIYCNFFRETEQRYLENLQELDENKIVTSLTSIFSEIICDFYKKGIYRFFEEENHTLVMRKIPDEEKELNERRIEGMVGKILAYFYIEDKKDIARFTSALSLLFLTLPAAEKVPNIKEALELLIRGLVLQLVGE
jgi:Transcriptional regulator